MYYVVCCVQFSVYLTYTMSYAIVNSRLLSFRCNIRLLNRFFKVKATPSEDILLHQHCRRYSSRDKNESNFGQSIILLQDGANFQELPIIVRRVNDELVLLKNVERGKCPTFTTPNLQSKIAPAMKRCLIALAATRQKMFQLQWLFPP